MFLYSIQPPLKAVTDPAQINKSYGVLSLLFLIFAFSTFCWFSEGVIYLIRDGVLPNRSFLLGLWVPLYGLFGLVLLFVIKRFTNHPTLSFAMMTVTYSMIQYLPNLLIKSGWNAVSFVNTGGFINQGLSASIGGSVYFSLIGCAFLYYLAPKWDAYFKKMPQRLRILICILLGMILLASIIGKGA